MGWGKKREQNLVRREPPPEGDADPHVEAVRQRRRISPRVDEVAEQPSRESNASGRPELEQQSNARTDAGHGRGEGIVDIQGAKDEEPMATTAPHQIRDDLPGPEARDRTERPLAEVAGGAEEKIGSRPMFSCGNAELHGGVHRPRSGEPLRAPRRMASTPCGVGVQS